MTDHNDNGDGGRLYQFPRIGFNLTPTTAPTPPMPTAPPAPDWDAVTVPSDGRRSPLDILNALPDPGITQPLIPTTPAPAPGHVPAAFRNEPAGDLVGPRLGALSLAAILAVAVAALRGTHGVLSDWRQRRLARQAETEQLREGRLKHQLAMQNIGDKAAQQRAKTHRVPSSSEFGRKSLGGRAGSSGGGRGGAGSGSGSGSSRRGGGLLSSGSGGAKKGSGKPSNGKGNGGSLFGGGSGSGKNGRHRNNGTGGGRNQKPKNPKGPHRTSQGAGAYLKKAADKNGRTSLADALKNDTHKAAARRLKRRRNNGQDKPALWKAGGGKNTPAKNGGKKNAGNNPAANTNGSRGGKKVNLTKGGPNNKQAGAKNTNPPRPDQAMWKNLRKAAARRWKKRQKRAQHTPPIWGVPRRNNGKSGAAGAGDANKKQQPGGGRHGWWAKARAYARKNARGGRFSSPGPKPGQQGQHTAGGQRARQSPFQNAGQAAASANPTYTVQRDDYVGAQAKRWEPAALTPGQAVLPATGPAALTTAPGSYPPRPGTSRPKEPIAMPPAPVPARPDPRIVKAKHQAARAAQHTMGRHMDAQHATEITLDDACDAADELTADCFKTHDESGRLAKKARDLRDTLALFAEDLAVNHNLIGPLFSAAMARLAESMDLVARMADEMETSSLEAAEKTETAGNELNDAYRPYTTATADAGLTTPSAPIHNRA